jgi:CTP:phosphocholine cytidylyltransferase-like protein
MHQWLLRRENNFYQARIHTPVQSWEKIVNKVETTLKNNYAFSSDVVTFREIFTCPLSAPWFKSWKERKKKNCTPMFI